MTYKYDAFISYKHEPLDIYAAETLQKILENYRVPKAIQSSSKKKKINRIFRDREELSLSSDLSETIQDALIHSEFLIVICSPESKQSAWVQKEVEFFLEHHDRNKILALLIKGEPGDSFPDAIQFKTEKIVLENGETQSIQIPIEPLAGDVRCINKKELVKKLKEESLRFLAPMLYCSYDQLKQRHREYTLKRNFRVAGIIAIIMSIFSVYALWQSQRVTKQYHIARENQARYLSKISIDLFKKGDRNMAIKTALAIQNDNSDEAIIPEQFYALNTALYSYKAPNYLVYKPYATGDINGGYQVGCLSPEGTYFLAIDNYGNANLLNGENGTCFWSIKPSDFDVEDETFYYALSISEDKAVLISRQHIFYIDVTNQSLINQITADSFYSSSHSNYAVHENRLAFVHDTDLYVYHLDTGNCILKSNIMKKTERFTDCSVSSMDFSKSGKKIAISFNGDKNPDAGILLVSLEDESKQTISTLPTDHVTFIQNNRIAALQHRPNDDIIVSDINDSKNNDYSLALYDLTTNKLLLESKRETQLDWGISLGITIAETTINNKVVPCLLAHINEKLFIVNLNKNSIIQELSYHSSICKIQPYDKQRFFLGLSNGTAQILSTDSLLQKIELDIIDADISDFFYSQKYQTIIQISEETIVFSASKADSHLVALKSPSSIDSSYYANSVKYYQATETVYRCVLYTEAYSYPTNAIALYTANTAEPCYTFQTESSAETITNIAIGPLNDRPVLCFVVSNEENSLALFYLIDLSTKKTLLKKDLGQYDSLSFASSDITYSPTMEYFVVRRIHGGAVLFNITIDDVVPETIALLRGKSLNEIHISGDGRYLILTSATHTFSENNIYIYDTHQRNYIVPESELTFNGTIDITIGKSSPYIALCKNNKSIEIIDCSVGKITCSLPTEHYSNFDFSFFDNDQCLITCIDKVITMWDTAIGETIMQYTLSEDNSAFAYTIQTDSNNNYFAIKDSSLSYSSTGKINSQNLFIFSVDDKHSFYPYASVDYGYCSFAGNEIGVLCSPNYFYSTIYNFEFLKETAMDVLGNDVLTDSEKKEYFISN